MCLTPNRITLENGNEIEVGCRKCWQCRSNRVNDYVGRSIAESLHSLKSLAITLTYGGGDRPEAYILQYEDVQKFMKRVRKVYNPRYIVAGEYGGEKGRAHWHIILFFKKNEVIGQRDYPELVQPTEIKESVLKLNPTGTKLKPTKKLCLDRDMSWTLWPAGHVYVQEPSYGSFRYLLKYLLKEQAEGKVAVRNFGMSMQPPLGYEYFREYARKHVRAGLTPRNYEYSFDTEYRDNGERRKFFIQGKSRENFVQYFLEEWEREKGTRPPAHEMILNHLHKQAEIDDIEWQWEQPQEPDELVIYRMEAKARQSIDLYRLQNGTHQTSVPREYHWGEFKQYGVLTRPTSWGKIYGVPVRLYDEGDKIQIYYQPDGEEEKRWLVTEKELVREFRKEIEIERIEQWQGERVALLSRHYYRDWHKRGKTEIRTLPKH